VRAHLVTRAVSLTVARAEFAVARIMKVAGHKGVGAPWRFLVEVAAVDPTEAAAAARAKAQTKAQAKAQAKVRAGRELISALL